MAPMRAAGTAPADAEAEIAIKGYVKELGWHTEQLERLNREEVEMLADCLVEFSRLTRRPGDEATAAMLNGGGCRSTDDFPTPARQPTGQKVAPPCGAPEDRAAVADISLQRIARSPKFGLLVDAVGSYKAAIGHTLDVSDLEKIRLSVLATAGDLRVAYEPRRPRGKHNAPQSSTVAEINKELDQEEDLKLALSNLWAVRGERLTWADGRTTPLWSRPATVDSTDIASTALAQPVKEIVSKGKKAATSKTEKNPTVKPAAKKPTLKRPPKRSKTEQYSSSDGDDGAAEPVMKNATMKNLQHEASLDDDSKISPAYEDGEEFASLEKWVLCNLPKPYPSQDQKDDFAQELKMSPNEIHNWFCNVRKRKVAPILNRRREPRNKFEAAVAAWNLSIHQPQ
mmetsp:Transcript_23604/g.84245  ORF Transcript_23604/g.84245 Transcript_23604/m.84245 type:complete len:398 (+) Transcript_23604:44-1237(+)